MPKTLLILQVSTSIEYTFFVNCTVICCDHTADIIAPEELNTCTSSSPFEDTTPPVSECREPGSEAEKETNDTSQGNFLLCARLCSLTSWILLSVSGGANQAGTDKAAESAPKSSSSKDEGANVGTIANKRG